VATPLGAVPASGLAEGTTVEVLIRAEALSLHESPSGAARLLDAKLLGAVVALRLALDGAEPLIARVRRSSAPRPGSRFSVSLDPAGTFVFPAGR
jgi:iron(III) transport system ATP-binding protein